MLTREFENMVVRRSGSNKKVCVFVRNTIMLLDDIFTYLDFYFRILEPSLKKTVSNFKCCKYN